MSHARGVSAGWLGHLDRGGTALMPMVVAEYVLDASVGKPAADHQLIVLAGGTPSFWLLYRVAHRRLAGQDASVRLAREAVLLAGVFSGWTRAVDPSGVGV